MLYLTSGTNINIRNVKVSGALEPLDAGRFLKSAGLGGVEGHALKLVRWMRKGASPGTSHEVALTGITLSRGLVSPFVAPQPVLKPGPNQETSRAEQITKGDMEWK